MPGLFVEPPPIGPIVVLVEELLFLGVLLVVPTLAVGPAPPELMVVVADVPVWAWAGRYNKAAPATRVAVVRIRAIMAITFVSKPPHSKRGRAEKVAPTVA
jgi:hypothetical protein